jgi:sugar/nucleoside kinase (ribokinase family)
VICNEIESSGVWNINVRNGDGSLNLKNIRLTLEKMMESGVKDRAVVHSKEGGFCMNAAGAFTAVPSLHVEPERIRGRVGAGDAFCAGCLYGLYNGVSDEDMLRFASASAAASLFSATSTDGMLSREELLNLMKNSSWDSMDVL